MKRIFSRENLWALALCLILILVVIFTASSVPLWIYQGYLTLDAKINVLSDRNGCLVTS